MMLHFRLEIGSCSADCGDSGEWSWSGGQGVFVLVREEDGDGFVLVRYGRPRIYHG